MISQNFHMPPRHQAAQSIVYQFINLGEFFVSLCLGGRKWLFEVDSIIDEKEGYTFVQEIYQAVCNGWLEYTGLKNLHEETRTKILTDINSLFH